MKLKRVLSLLMALVMTVSLLTLPSYAEDEAAAEETTTVEAVTHVEDAAPTEEMGKPASTEEVPEVMENTVAVPAESFINVAPFVQTAGATSSVKKLMKVSTLKSAGDPTAPVPPTFVDGSSPDGLILAKAATYNEETKSYDIKLEAYTTGNVTTTTTTKPTDIVLVLDMSGSMNDPFADATYGYTPVNGGRYWYGQTTYYGFENYSSTYYIKLDDGTYQQVIYSDDDNKNFDYYYYTTGSGWNQTTHYVYPQLADGTTTARRQYNYNVVQFYTLTEVAAATTRIDALKSAVNTFIDATATQNESITNSADKHRIAIVKFAGDKTDTVGNDMYDEWSLFSKDTYNYSQIVNNLTVVDDTGKTTLSNSINQLSAAGATSIDYGMEHAQTILNGVTDPNRNKVVIVFTDGEPNHDNGFDTNVANSALGTSKALKDKGVTVYTICVDPNAKVNAGQDLPSSNTDINRFMHLLSSNYPAATAMNSRGNGGSTGQRQADGTYKSYYLVPTNQSELTSIFQQISQQSGSSSIDLGSNTEIKDIVSPYFTMPTNTSAVTVKTYDCTGFTDGKPTWKTTGTELTNAVTIDSTNNAVNVKSFDFNNNFVAEAGRKEGDPTQPGNFHGRKLEITFTVTPKDGFWGGNNVPTNGTDSGVYAKDGTKIATFDVPTVNVPLNIPNLTASDKNIYLLNDAPSATDLGTFAVPTEAWKTQYVKISPITTDVEISNTEDTDNIPLSVTVTPKYTGKDASGTVQNAVEKKATAKVNVFKPEVSFKDSTIYQGNTADYRVNMTNDPVWKHNGTLDTDVTMTGTKLNLSYDYSEAAAAFEDCTPVAVTVKIGTEDVTNKTNGKKDFTVHVLQPTVTATVNDVQKYYGESYTLGTDANGEINVTWTDKRTDHSNIPAASGTKPYEARDLTLAYSTEAFNGQDGIVPNSDFAVTVKVMKGDTEMPDATITTSCTLNKDCKTPDNDGVYTVHVKTCTITVKKSGCSDLDYHAANNTGNAEYQSFIFEVNGDEDNNVQIAPIKVTVQGNGEVKIVGLPTGTYTVTENQGWSWRYEAQNNGVATADLNTNHAAAVTITNTRTNPYWLSGDNFAINKFSPIAGQNIH